MAESSRCVSNPQYRTSAAGLVRYPQQEDAASQPTAVAHGT
jgi:hypothetical protein